MNCAATFSAELLKIDAAAEAQRIEAAICNSLSQLKRKGVVLGLSGGIDSSVVATLLARALGKAHVFGIFMPDEDSSNDSLVLGQRLAEFLGIETVLENIGPILRAAGCYERRDRAISTVVPEYTSGYKCKIVLPDLLNSARYSLYSIVVQSPSGECKRVRMSAEAYLGVVAATNFKQRTRKMIEYYHADRLNYAVAGTPNRLEYDQGFFVKNGDGTADLKPIAHLYKSQVYQLAAWLGIPEEIRSRPSTTDTYSLSQSQEEFYFGVPLPIMDLCLYASNHGFLPAEVAPVAELTVSHVERVYAMIEAKRRATRYLHLKPLLVESIDEVQP